MIFLILYSLLLFCAGIYIARMFWTLIRRDALEGFSTRGFVWFAILIHLAVVAFWCGAFWYFLAYQRVVVQTVSADLPYPTVLAILAVALLPMLGAFLGMVVAMRFKRSTTGVLQESPLVQTTETVSPTIPAPSHRKE